MTESSNSRVVPMDCASCQEPCTPDEPWAVMVCHVDPHALSQLHPVQAAHYRCQDPDTAMYVMDPPASTGVHTEHSLLGWCAQLSEKTWLPYAAWGIWLRQALEGTR